MLGLWFMHKGRLKSGYHPHLSGLPPLHRWINCSWNISWIATIYSQAYLITLKSEHKDLSCQQSRNFQGSNEVDGYGRFPLLTFLICAYDGLYISFSLLSRKLQRQFSTEDAQRKSFQIQVPQYPWLPWSCMASSFSFQLQTAYLCPNCSQSVWYSVLVGWGLTHMQVGLFVLGP